MGLGGEVPGQARRSEC